MSRILAALDVPRDGGPASSEGADFLAATDDEDASLVSEDRRDHALRLHVRQLDRTPISVDDHSISCEQTADVHTVHHRDPREGCANRDYGVRASVHNRGGTVTPLPEAVENVRAHRASFPGGECEDSAFQPFARDARRLIKNRSVGRIHAADEREYSRGSDCGARRPAGNDSARAKSHA